MKAVTPVCNFLITCLFLIHSFSFGFSQADVRLGKEYERLTGYIFPDPIGLYKNQLLAYGHYGFGKSDDHFIEKYDSSLQLIQSEKFFTGMYKTKELFLSIQFWGDKIFYFTSLDDEASHIKKLFVAELDCETLKPKGEKRELYRTAYKKKETFSSCQFFSSPNGILHGFFTVVSEDEKLPMKIQLLVLGPEMDKIWEKECTLSVTEKLTENTECVLDNAGSIYFSQRVYYEKKRPEVDDKPNYEYRIFAFQEQGQISKEYTVKFPKEFISDFFIKIAPSGNLTYAGFFSGVYEDLAKGFLLGGIETTSWKPVFQKLTAFDGKTLAASSDKESPKVQGESKSYLVKDMAINEKGEVLLFSEQYFFESKSVGNPQTSQLVSCYNYRHILAAGFSEQGNLNWMTVIPKSQYSESDTGYFLSCSLTEYNGNYYLIYNDNPENLKTREKSATKWYNLYKNQTQIIICEITAEGKWQKTLLLDSKDNLLRSRPKVAIQSGMNGAIILPLINGRIYSFGHVRFN